MKRRATFLALALLTSVALPVHPDRVFRVGGFELYTEEGSAQRKAFRDALTSLGWSEGRNVAYVTSDPGRDRERIAKAAAELVAQKPDVIVVWESEARTLRQHTSTIPIVLNGGIDPVAAGLAQSLARPGGNVTGVAQLNAELPAKHVELLGEILPRLSRVGMLYDRGAWGCQRVADQARAAVQTLKKTLTLYEVSTRAEVEQAFVRMETESPDALLPCPSAMLFNNRDLLFREVSRLRIPLTSFIVANVPDGVLFAFSSSRAEEYRRAAFYVDRILKGANPAELPIEQPTRFELVINLRTAKALGIAVPRSVLFRADRVIE